MPRRQNSSSLGSIGCGCLLWIMAFAAWGFSFLIFPKLPDYEVVMEKGEVVPGKVIRIETVENVTINDRNPQKVTFSYGDGKEGVMTMALRERARKGQELTVRVLGETAYPEEIRPLQKPGWVTWAMIGAAAVGTLFVLGGILRLLLIGGVLFAGGRALAKKQQQSPPPPPPPS